MICTVCIGSCRDSLSWFEMRSPQITGWDPVWILVPRLQVPFCKGSSAASVGDDACHKVLLCCHKLYQWFKKPQCLQVLNVVVQLLCIWSSLLTKRPTNISLWDSYCFSLIIIIALEEAAFQNELSDRYGEVDTHLFYLKFLNNNNLLIRLIMHL